MELTEQLRSTEDKGRAEREALLDHLHGLKTESAAAKLENQSLKVKPAESVSSLDSGDSVGECYSDFVLITMSARLIHFCLE